MTFALPDLYAQVGHFLWPAIRILALFGSAPLLNEKQPDRKTKLLLAMFITFLIAPGLPVSDIPVLSLIGVAVAFQQIIIGVGMGLTVQLVFVTVRMAGEITGLQMGLSFASFFDPISGGNTPVVARLMNLLVTLLFLTFNGHLWLITLLSDSFAMLPVDAGALNSHGFYYLVQQAGVIFSSGLMLGMPIIILLLAINLILGLLNRLTPQLSIFVIGFPLTLSVGMLSLSMLMTTLPPFFARLVGQIFQQLSQLLLLLR